MSACIFRTNSAYKGSIQSISVTNLWLESFWSCFAAAARKNTQIEPRSLKEMTKDEKPIEFLKMQEATYLFSNS